MSTLLTELMVRLRAGDKSAMGEVASQLYATLRSIAARQLRNERQNHTLQPTALLHEAYLKLAGAQSPGFSDEVHFLAVASRVMRQVLVDHARARTAGKRRGDAIINSSWTANLEIKDDQGVELVELIELNNAIDALAVENQTMARLVEMRYFGGMTAEESAKELDISVHVVRHDLRFAQAWLKKRFSGSDS